MCKKKTSIKSKLANCLIFGTVIITLISCTINPPQTKAYLFTYFTGNGPEEEAIRYAVSLDGYNYRALNNNEPVLDSKEISTSGGVRDPHILRGDDGKTFYMVATDLYVPCLLYTSDAADDLLCV